MTFADSYFQKCHQLMNENSKLKRKIMQLELEIMDLSVDIEEQVLKENEQLRTKNNAYIQDIEVFKEENTHLKLENEMLKSFIKSLASPDGKIWLSRGYVYRIDKILNDFNNTENDDGDVE